MPAEPSLMLAAELFGAGLMLIVCLSHISAPAVWCRLFQDAFKQPAAGLVIGLITLTWALPVWIVHWRWTGDLRSIITVFAWGSMFKGTLYMLWPAAPARISARHTRHPRRFVAAGVAGCALSLFAFVGVLSAERGG